LLQANGRKHLTKAEIENRKKNELKLGNRKLKCPDFVKNDVKAYEKWKEITKIYKDVDFVSSGDVGLLARYCKTFSEYHNLLKAYQRVSEIHYDCDELDEALEAENEIGDSLFSYKVKKQLRDLFAINAILTIETAINKNPPFKLPILSYLSIIQPVTIVKIIPAIKDIISLDAE
jgi:phage terminase small subunit